MASSFRAPWFSVLLAAAMLGGGGCGGDDDPAGAGDGTEDPQGDDDDASGDDDDSSSDDDDDVTGGPADDDDDDTGPSEGDDDDDDDDDDVSGPDAGVVDDPDAGDMEEPDGGSTDELRARIEQIDGLTIVDEDASSGYRIFDMLLTQPADHEDPDGQTFQQRVRLLHFDEAAPMVLHTEGYNLSGPRRTELTRIFSANQLAAEHRFFLPSRPDPADWSLLTIEQAAADHHRIVTLFKTIYGGAWINTGASKGGMTSIYHRRFYPDDVDATVPYVAPISFGAPDERYVGFFDTVGDPDCRMQIRALQREILGRREAMLPKLTEWSEQWGATFDLYGLEAAFEAGVIEFEWAFWQYIGDSGCDSLPVVNADDDELFDYFDESYAWYFVSDSGFFEYQPYFFQAETQLGFPAGPWAHVADLLEHDYEAFGPVMPKGALVEYDPAPMQDIAEWVMREGAQLLFVYGEYDPWTAGAFALSDANRETFSFMVPRGTHGADLLSLPNELREQALGLLEQWTGAQPVPALLLSTGALDTPAPRRFRL